MNIIKRWLTYLRNRKEMREKLLHKKRLAERREEQQRKRLGKLYSLSHGVCPDCGSDAWYQGEIDPVVVDVECAMCGAQFRLGFVTSGLSHAERITVPSIVVEQEFERPHRG